MDKANIVFPDTDPESTGRGRPFIAKYSTPPSYQTNDNVYTRATANTPREGPFVIARVNTTSSPARYVLSLADGTLVYGGREIEEGDLIRG
ncbi:MAG: hypothetical protein Q9186_006264 [Xanthomendoza sp. 1 TL-2023]